MIPFASLYSTTTISALATGMGCTGLVTSILSLVQQSDANNPIFGVSIYFYILLFFFLCSIVCSCILLRIPTQDSLKQIHEQTDSLGIDSQSLLDSTVPLSSKSSLWSVLNPALNQFYISLLNYILVSVGPYLVVGFQQQEQTILIFWMSFGNIFLGAIARAITSVVTWYNLPVLTLSQILLWIYLMIMCFVQQQFKLTIYYGWISVFLYSIFSAIYGYTDTLNYHQASIIFQTEHHLIHKASTVIGTCNQIGAVCGSIVGFILVFFNVFHS